MSKINVTKGMKLMCVEGDGHYVETGKIYTATGQRSHFGWILLKEFNNGCSFFDYRFVVVSEKFNISTATDQELADEYRKTWLNCCELWENLVGRGYNVRYKTSECKEIVITKEERTVVSL